MAVHENADARGPYMKPNGQGDKVRFTPGSHKSQSAARVRAKNQQRQGK